ncbi:MAG TPA: glutathione S-transferase family protein [Terriglobales bacterium]|nr:glutathione S-transferase family protein [Terriglobales bacterium]
MIKLYHHLDCPYSQKVRVVMAEKGLEYEKKAVDLQASEQKSQEFLKLNPYGRVPVLVDEDVIVYDSTIINEYLDEEYPDPPLMPAAGESADRARVRQLEDFCDNSFIFPTFRLLAELYKPEGQRDDEVVRNHQTELIRVLSRLELQLEGREFLVGEFSLADAAFVPRILILPQMGIEMDPRWHNVPAWINRLRERNSVRELNL